MFTRPSERFLNRKAEAKLSNIVLQRLDLESDEEEEEEEEEFEEELEAEETLKSENVT